MFLRYLVTMFLSAGLTLGVIAFPQQEDAPPAPAKNQESAEPKQEQDKIDVPARGPEAIARRDFMQSKLRYSQMVFEGLTTGNLKLVGEAGIEIREITQGSQWVSVDDERYRQLTSEFETATARLIEASKSGNIDATALRYYQMSTSCIDCHKHIRKVGYEF